MTGRFWSSVTYRYGFNGKENDNEINVDGGSYDFGARIYDSRLARWFSLDLLANKFPYLTPYNFAGLNPILYLDMDGKILVIGGPTEVDRLQAKNDILSLVPENMRGAVSFSNNEDGTMRVDFVMNLATKGSVEGGGSGPELLHNLVNAKEKYMYEVNDGKYKTLIKQSNGNDYVREDNMNERSNGTLNLSVNERYSSKNTGEINQVESGPVPYGGYDGKVILKNNFTWTEKNGKIKNRSSVVFHELWENWERTTNNLPYDYPIFDSNGSVLFKNPMIPINPIWDKTKDGAHDKAVIAEERFHEKSEEPGVSD